MPGTRLGGRAPHLLGVRPRPPQRSRPAPGQRPRRPGGRGGGGAARRRRCVRAARPAAAQPAAAPVKQWTKLPAIQPGEQSLKFVIPRDWPAGVYACRVTAAGATTDPVLLNVPDPWWAQGDEGRSRNPRRLAARPGQVADDRQGAHHRPPGTRPRQPRQPRRHTTRPPNPSPSDPPRRTPTPCGSTCPATSRPARTPSGSTTAFGGEAAWRSAGTIRIEPAAGRAPPPSTASSKPTAPTPSPRCARRWSSTTSPPTAPTASWRR